MRGYLKVSPPGVPSLGALGLEDPEAPVERTGARKPTSTPMGSDLHHVGGAERRISTGKGKKGVHTGGYMGHTTSISLSDV